MFCETPAAPGADFKSFSAISANLGTKTSSAVRSRSDIRKGTMPMKVSFIGVYLAMLLMMWTFMPTFALTVALPSF